MTEILHSFLFTLIQIRFEEKNLGYYLPPPPKEGLSGGAKAAITIAVIAVILFASFIVLYRDPFNFFNKTSSGSQDSIFPDSSQFVTKSDLEVDINEKNNMWRRNSFSDLPELQKELVFTVENKGNCEAKNVQVTIKENWAIIREYSISTLQVYDMKTYSVTVTIDYDKTKTITIEAVSSESSDDKTITVKAELPRDPDSKYAQLFITPEENDVIELKNQILENKNFLTPNWIALRDWVGNNIQYEYDSVKYDGEYSQLPEETIKLGTGDCEDFSILLCSLLRADGWSSDNVYVVLGEDGDSRHAWVQIIWNGLQYNIEPQTGGWNTVIGDYFSLSGYNAEYIFNDVYYGNV